MKKTALVLISLIFSTLVFAQIKYTNQENDFSVTFPKTPEYSAKESGDDGKIVLTHYYIAMSENRVLYTVSMTVNSAGGRLFDDTDLQPFMSNTAEGFFQALDVKPTPLKNIKSGKIKGQEYSGNNDKYSIIYRVFVNSDKLFQVIIMGVSQDPPKKVAKTFFKSFKIL